jgi:hypothetical protein
MSYINYLKKNCKKSPHPVAYCVGAIFGLFVLPIVLPILWVEKKALKQTPRSVSQ